MIHNKTNNKKHQTLKPKKLNKAMVEKKFNSRLKIINYLYQLILLEETFNSEKAFETGGFNVYEIKVIDNISKYFDKFVNTIKKYLNDTWRWTRLDPLEQAILIYGAFELQINDLPIVINELVIITKGLIPGEKYKYINSVLEKIGQEYIKTKNHGME